MNYNQMTIRSIKRGALPIVEKFISILTIDSIFGQLIPTDARDKIPVWKTLTILLRNIILERNPLYKIGEWAASRSLLDTKQLSCVTDDRIGRALDRLFISDRAALVTQIVLTAIQRFEIDLSRIHNDSTSISLHGEYDN